MKRARVFTISGLLVIAASLMLSLTAWSAEEMTGEAEMAEAVSLPEAIQAAAFAIGAGIAVGLTGIATGLAQSKIGSAGIGALAENPKLLGVVILLVAIPETVVILGFVVAAIILFV